MTGFNDAFHDLPQRTRRQIVDKVRNDNATFRGAAVTDAQLHDLVRWTVNAYAEVVGDEKELEAYDNGVSAALDGRVQKAAG